MLRIEKPNAMGYFDHGASSFRAVLGNGYGLHWEGLDVDLSIPALLAGIFGTQRYMAQRAGQARSAAKAAAARVNGAKGGRPRKRA